MMRRKHKELGITNSPEHNKLNRLITLTSVGMFTLLGTSIYGLYEASEREAEIQDNHRVIVELFESISAQREQFNECMENQDSAECRAPVVTEPETLIVPDDLSHWRCPDEYLGEEVLVFHNGTKTVFVCAPK